MCSAGDFYGTADVFNEPKSHFVAKMMGYLKYDAVGVGEMDLNFGVDKLLEDAKTYELPVTSASVLVRGDRKAKKGPARKYGTIFPPYLLVKRGGVKFGFIGILSPRTRIRNKGAATAVDSDDDIVARSYMIKTPDKSLAPLIKDVRKKSDVVVLLAHMDREDLDALLPELPPVDLVVIGHEMRSGAYSEPEVVAGAKIVKATSQGQYIGRAWLTFDDDNKLDKVQCQTYVLDNKMADDPEVTAMLDAFDDENREVQKKLYAREQLSAAESNAPGEGGFIGLGACIQCHAKQFEVYKGTGHAHAYQTLAADFTHRDTNCVGCHVTGYGEKGGFDGVQHRSAPVDLIDVQCEACHGPGRDHTRDGGYRASAVASCVRCHTKDHDPDFDYATDWPKIAH